MELTRIIHPVGQGAFYTETLINDKGEYFNVVYDCGSMTGKNILENRIDSYLDHLKKQQTNVEEYEKVKKAKIDAVFISHFHEDHVNGFQYLFDNKEIEIKKIYIPQLSEEQLFEMYVYNLIHINKNRTKKSEIIIESNANKLLINLYKKEQYSKQVQQIKQCGSTESNIDQTAKSRFDYLYIPYNPQILDELQYRKFCKDFQKTFKINSIDIKKLVNIIRNKDDLKKCKEIYSKYFKNHNSYSMCLFSGVQNGNIHDFKEYDSSVNFFHCCKTNLQKCCCDFSEKIKNPNCLYTGDFEVKRYNLENLKKFYINYLKTISSIQVPHHGSGKNFNEDLYISNILLCFISVGEQNKYHHPSLKTLVGIIEKYCLPIIVTERTSTKRIYNYISNGL